MPRERVKRIVSSRLFPLSPHERNKVLNSSEFPWNSTWCRTETFVGRFFDSFRNAGEQSGGGGNNKKHKANDESDSDNELVCKMFELEEEEQRGELKLEITTRPCAVYMSHVCFAPLYTFPAAGNLRFANARDTLLCSEMQIQGLHALNALFGGFVVSPRQLFSLFTLSSVYGKMPTVSVAPVIGPAAYCMLARMHGMFLVPVKIGPWRPHLEKSGPELLRDFLVKKGRFIACILDDESHAAAQGAFRYEYFQYHESTTNPHWHCIHMAARSREVAEGVFPGAAGYEGKVFAQNSSAIILAELDLTPELMYNMIARESNPGLDPHTYAHQYFSYPATVRRSGEENAAFASAFLQFNKDQVVTSDFECSSLHASDFVELLNGTRSCLQYFGNCCAFQCLEDRLRMRGAARQYYARKGVFPPRIARDAGAWSNLVSETRLLGIETPADDFQKTVLFWALEKLCKRGGLENNRSIVLRLLDMCSVREKLPYSEVKQALVELVAAECRGADVVLRAVTLWHREPGRLENILDTVNAALVNHYIKGILDPGVFRSVVEKMNEKMANGIENNNSVDEQRLKMLAAERKILADFYMSMSSQQFRVDKIPQPRDAITHVRYSGAYQSFKDAWRYDETTQTSAF